MREEIRHEPEDRDQATFDLRQLNLDSRIGRLYVQLEELLPTVGKAIAVAHYHDMSERRIPPDCLELLENMSTSGVDSIINHPRWHEFDIVTHSIRVRSAALSRLANFERDGIVSWAVKTLQGSLIDDLSQFDLFIASMPLHDIGKFQPVLTPSAGDLILTHQGHEGRSADIFWRSILYDAPEHLRPLGEVIDGCGLTVPQLGFIEACIRLHYQFGNMHAIAAKHDGYSIAFTESNAFREECLRIASEHSGYYPPNFNGLTVVKGLYFLVDCAGKVDAGLQDCYPIDRDEEIGRHVPLWRDHIEAHGLPAELIEAFCMVPVYRAAAVKYLEICRKLKGST